MSYRNVLPHLQVPEIIVFFTLLTKKDVCDKILEFGSPIISVNNIFDVI